MPINYANTNMLTGVEFNNWQTTYSTVQSNSATWSSVISGATYTRWQLTGNPPISSFSINGAVSNNANAYRVTVGSVLQDPASYTINNSPGTITFSEAPALSSNIIVLETIVGFGSNGNVASTVISNSANWQNTYTTVQGNSATWINGKVAQVVYTEDATLVTTTAFFPQDNTTPQDNEGAAYTQLDTTITPTNSSSKLLIEAVVNFNANNVNTPNFGIFGPFSTNAIQFYSFTSAGNGFASVAILRVRVDAVNTNAQTYKVRFGSQNASYTTRINSGTTFNNSLKSTLTITEILP